MLTLYLGGLKGLRIVSCVLQTQITKKRIHNARASARARAHAHIVSALTQTISRRRLITVEALVQYQCIRDLWTTD